ncbi:hypothetical protein BV25DRAFT_1412581 [Artomyces pyxidatus]|uniref:Uncharacterized protein n=1 Tax=Artomyces pyxidatus TaxID=48021 RepID=A0ACB8TDX0_9AGAM|nr:hypothetical protein BV25DRAFT_1412581 [Artomyces pyxidatus]
MSRTSMTEDHRNDIAHCIDPQLQPIVRIPIEILERIICCRLRQSKNFSPNTPVSATLAPWLDVLHVCRQWRKVACHSKDFWGLVLLEKGPYTTVSLAMTGPSSFLIQASLDPSLFGDGSTLSVYLPRAEAVRAQELRIEWRWGNTDAEHTLKVNFVGKGWTPHSSPTVFDDVFDERPCRPFPMPEDFFQQQHPAVALRSLQLTGCTVSPHAALVLFTSDLTRLELTRCHLWETYEEMMATLSSIPYLEVLSIDQDILPPVRDAPSPMQKKTERLRLSQLFTLYLDGDCSQIHKTMQLLSLPQDVDLSLNYRSWDQRESADDLATILAAHLSLPIRTGMPYSTLEFHQLSRELPNQMILKPRIRSTRRPGILKITLQSTPNYILDTIDTKFQDAALGVRVCEPVV